ncbi:MAG: DNA polymerase III subunit delta' [Lonepinella koalarum]|nr:DNA polymerase III subunit delta' [Lonepinella koalarum]
MTELYPWLTPTYRQIRLAFEQQHGHHALLFKADSGLGVEQLIHSLAKFLLCDLAESSIQHHNHHLFSSGNHPDYHLLAPIEGKDIGIDQVREINEKVSQFAQQGGNKVIYLQGIERLTENAANALLKTLEEPTANTYFLLQADLSSTILPTIHSRCQTWLITVPQMQVSLEWLQSQYSEKTDDISTALRINHNKPLQALAMLEQGLMEKRREFLRQFWIFYIRRSPLELLAHFDKDNPLPQLDWLTDFLTDALKAKLGIQEGWICQDVIRGIQQFNEQQTAQGLLKANQIMQKVRSDLTQINAVNQELILLDGLTKLITDVFET